MKSRPDPALAPDIWLLVVSLAAGLGTARLTMAPGASHVVGPIVATVVAGHLGASAARRLRVSLGVVVAGGVVAVMLATIWGQLLSATRYGIPTPGTWKTLVAKFDAAGAVIRSHPTPVPATPEVVLCIATGAGLVAVFSRSIWAWQEARSSGAIVALVPTFGLFCYTALLSSQVDRVAGVVTYVLCALAFVIVADRATGGRSRWQTHAQRSLARRAASGLLASLPGVVGAALAVVVPLAASPALATLKVDALPFPPSPGAPSLGLATGNPGTPGFAGSGGGYANPVPGATGVRAIDLVDNLKAVLVNRTSDVMFEGVSPLPTYWQVAVLTDFNGTAWLPDPTTEAAAQSFALSPQYRQVAGLPALPEPQATKTFTTQITIWDLESTLLPLPPTTLSVNTDADLVPGFGAVQPVEAAPGYSFLAVARVPVDPTKSTKPVTSTPPHSQHGATSAPTPPATTGGTTNGVGAAALAPYLQLPAEPAAVVALAHQIVAGARGPAAEAAALARWFDSGRFHYTLTPPAPTKSNALESFLLTSRAGFCQQFAAAFGVLARIDGLPTRVAVGFTTGTSVGHQQYRITGADAHVWPEVYLGPSTGWTSYEPTPASSGESTGVGVNSGTKSGTRPGARSTPTTASTVATIRHPFSPNVTVPATLSPAQRRRATATITPGGSSNHTTTLALAIGISVAALVVVTGLWMRLALRRGWDPLGLLRARRRRRRRRRAPNPTAEVLVQWHDAVTMLERARLGRRPAETLHEHATRLRSLAGAKWLMPYRPVTVGPPDSTVPPGAAGPSNRTEITIEATIEAYAQLAELAARASYGPEPSTPAEAVDAELLGAVVRSGLTGRSGHRRVLVSS